MSKRLEMGRKYTWGEGNVEYSLLSPNGIYCHTTGTWLDNYLVNEHLKSVTLFPDFRYVDEASVITDTSTTADDVRQPSHYQVFPDVESIEIIARSMTRAEFKGFCMGNVLKYRLRAGKKSELATMEKDLKKADFYKELFEQHKDKCYE